VEHRPSSEHQTPAPASPGIGNRRATMKMIRDPVLGMVIVYELDPSKGESGPPTLVFETQGTKVRLETFPADWRRMDEKELIALLTKRP
jgi:hypothetical protein